MPDGAREACFKKSPDDVERQFRPGNACSKTKDIGIIIFNALMSRESIFTKGRAYPFEFIGCDTGADPAAADQNAAFGSAVLDRLSKPLGIVGIIITRFQAMGPHIEDPVPEQADAVQNLFLQREAGVIAADDDFQVLFGRGWIGHCEGTPCVFVITAVSAHEIADDAAQK